MARKHSGTNAPLSREDLQRGEPCFLSLLVTQAQVFAVESFCEKCRTSFKSVLELLGTSAHTEDVVQQGFRFAPSPKGRPEISAPFDRSAFYASCCAKGEEVADIETLKVRAAKRASWLLGLCGK